MNYKRLLEQLNRLVVDDAKEFPEKSKIICALIAGLDRAQSSLLARSIHAIPESYPHDSTEEKLYAKASDGLVSVILSHFGLTSRVLEERGDAADVVAQSPRHGYSLVADSKVFRMSRTAKNQKDFKVTSMDNWRGDCDYAAVVCPLYQYPTRQSAIYAQSLDYNVALLSFEHIVFLLESGARETGGQSFSRLFSFPEEVSKGVKHAERKLAEPLLKALNRVVLDLSGKREGDWTHFLEEQRQELSTRARIEIRYWEGVRKRYESLTRKQAIKELIEIAGIETKIRSISEFLIEE